MQRLTCSGMVERFAGEAMAALAPLLMLKVFMMFYANIRR
jgi:hypothetical protein